MSGKPNPPWPYPPNEPVPCEPHPRPQPDDLRKPTNPLQQVDISKLRKWDHEERSKGC